MSQYTQFFLRLDKDKYLPLCSIGASNEFSAAFKNDLPFGKICPVTYEMLDEANQTLDDYIQQNKIEISQLAHKKAELKNLLTKETFNEVYDRQIEIDDTIKEIEEANEYYLAAIGRIDMLMSILEEQNKLYPYGADKGIPTFDPKTFLYGGIEAGYPIDADIQQKN